MRIGMRNRTTMPHPMNLHGQFFRQLLNGGSLGPEKDTILVAPRRELAIDFMRE